MQPLPSEVRSNSARFEAVLNETKEQTRVEAVFGSASSRVLSYLSGMGTEKQLVSVIGGQLSHHTFKKFFLGYNAYKVFSPEAEAPGCLADVLCLGEMLSIPILFMDDIMDSHTVRNGRPTPYSYLSKVYPGKGKEYTLFYSNIILNHLIGELMSKDVGHELKSRLLRTYADCANRTYMSQKYEHGFMPKSFDEVLGMYEKKSYNFTTRFMSEIGSAMGGGSIERGGALEKILLNLTYLVSIKNDFFDFFGDKRNAMEDMMSGSNSLGLYLVRLASADAAKLLEQKDMERVMSIVGSDDSIKEMLKRSIAIRNSIKELTSCYKGGGDWVGNYLLYADFMLKDLMVGVNHVR